MLHFALAFGLALDLLRSEHLVVVLDALDGHVVVSHLDVLVHKVNSIALVEQQVVWLDVEVLHRLLRKVEDHLLRRLLVLLL